MTLLSHQFFSHNIYYYESDDPVIGYLKNNQLYGLYNFNILNQFIKNNGAIIDCGAHIGTFSFTAALENKRMILIEGASKNIECLRETFNNMNNVSIFDTILLDKIKKCNFSEDYGPFGSVIENESGNRISSTIDYICSSLNEPVAAIKLDIEGNEPDALIGAVETLNKYKPPMLIEVNGHCLRLKNRKPLDLFDVLDSLNYSYFILNNNQIIPINKTDPFPFCVIDIIAIHNSNIHKYMGEHLITHYLQINQINEILEYNYNNSNDDCKQYFHTLTNIKL